jgi:hypothetical protein
LGAAARACLLIALAASSACSDAEELPPYLAANTYAGQHRADVEYNCSQAHACAELQMRGLEDNAFEQCVAMLATSLNTADGMSQLSWLVKVNRCKAPEPCRYNTCVTEGGIGFGEIQIAKVMHSCNARVQCALETGSLAGDATATYNQCLLQRILALDAYGTDAQAAYQNAYWPCSTLQSCQFTSCFAY